MLLNLHLRFPPPHLFETSIHLQTHQNNFQIQLNFNTSKLDPPHPPRFCRGHSISKICHHGPKFQFRFQIWFHLNFKTWTNLYFHSIFEIYFDFLRIPPHCSCQPFPSPKLQQIIQWFINNLILKFLHLDLNTFWIFYEFQSTIKIQ